MDKAKIAPTKGNLIATKKSLVLATQGYSLLEKKRNVLVHEMMLLVEKVKLLRNEITDLYAQAYFALQQANISKGVITEIANSVKIETTVKVTSRSVMGVEIPNVTIEKKELSLEYGFELSNSKVDEAYILFNQVKEMTVVLAEVDNSVYRLANAIRKTRKRANALKNVVIPNLEESVKYITEVLEEKDREEFSRLKVVKASKEKQALKEI